MAVYWGSLPQFTDTVGECAEPGEGARPPAPAEEAATDPVVHTGGDVALSGGSATATGDLANETQRLLELPPSRIERLLAELGESEGKALLVLIHRLATVESQLAALQARISVTAPWVPATAAEPTGRTRSPSASKSQLLEQVYRKNLLLRRMDESGPQC